MEEIRRGPSSGDTLVSQYSEGESGHLTRTTHTVWSVWVWLSMSSAVWYYQNENSTFPETMNEELNVLKLPL